MLPNSENKAVEILINLLANVIPTINEQHHDNGCVERELMLEVKPGNHIFIKVFRKASGHWILVDVNHEITVNAEAVSAYEMAARNLIDEIIKPKKSAEFRKGFERGRAHERVKANKLKSKRK
jgi:hypothetical protein